MPPRVQFTAEHAALQRVLGNPRHDIWWGRHASERMRERGITQSDVRRVLATGTVTFVEWKADELWHVEGHDVDRRSIKVVASVREQQLVIKLVTVFEPTTLGVECDMDRLRQDPRPDAGAGSVVVLDRYDASHLVGLNVVVIEGARRIFDEDGEEYISVPLIDQLSKAAAIARCLMPQRLLGQEIKAMRRIAGLTAKELARRLGEKTAPETLSRWERGDQGMGGYAEKVLRLVICEDLKDEVPGVEYDASMIAHLNQIDPWRAEPDYRVPAMEFHLAKVREDKQLRDAWNIEPRQAA